MRRRYGEECRITMLPDPDRPLLRLLNRAGGTPVLVMCGRPGNHDAAHAAAGRLPVRFHKYSDLRLFWREFPGRDRMRTGRGSWADLTGALPRFAGAIVLTNLGDPIADLSIAMILENLFEDDRLVLWGEAEPNGAIVWHPDFAIGPFVDEWAVFQNGYTETLSIVRADVRRLTEVET